MSWWRCRPTTDLGKSARHPLHSSSALITTDGALHSFVAFEQLNIDCAPHATQLCQANGAVSYGNARLAKGDHTY